MRTLLTIAALMLSLLVSAASAEAACANGVDQAVAADVAADVAELTAGPALGHGHHIPCTDTTHDHASCGCTGHSVIAMFAFGTPSLIDSNTRVTFANELANGRTLVPPVPPPLA
jgi:hypothetical protein